MPISAPTARDKVNVKARTGVFDGTKNSMVLTDGIAIKTSDGYQATLQDAKIDIGKGDLVSRKPVEIRSRDGWLKANGVSDPARRQVTFVNGVSVNFVPPTTPIPRRSPTIRRRPSPPPGLRRSPRRGRGRPAADQVGAKPAAAPPRTPRRQRLKSLTE